MSEISGGRYVNKEFDADRLKKQEFVLQCHQVDLYPFARLTNTLTKRARKTTMEWR